MALTQPIVPKSFSVVKCMVFEREPGHHERSKGHGTREFGRVPNVGEYISIDVRGPHLKVTHVHHLCFGDHAAEIYTIGAEDMVFVGGETMPPA